MEQVEKAVDGEEAMAGIHTLQDTTRCRPFQHLRARWEHIRRDFNSMTTNDIEEILRMRTGMMMMTTTMKTTMMLEMMVEVEEAKARLQRVKVGARMGNPRPN